MIPMDSIFFALYSAQKDEENHIKFIHFRPIFLKKVAKKLIFGHLDIDFGILFLHLCLGININVPRYFVF